jgi:hypothetical protein
LAAGIGALIVRSVIASGTLAGAGPFLVPAFAGVMLLIYLWLLYAFVRLTFLFLPATVAEHRIGIVRSWELTRGNFWRIFLIGIIVLLPVFVIGLCFVLYVLGPNYIGFVMQHANDQATIRAYAMEHVAASMQNLPFLLLVGLVVNPVLYGLMIAPAAFAYRALVPPPVKETAEAPADAHEQRHEEEAPLPERIEEVVDPHKHDGH